MVLLAEIMLNLSYIVADATSDGGLVIPYIIQCLKLCDRISADWVKIVRNFFSLSLASTYCI